MLIFPAFSPHSEHHTYHLKHVLNENTSMLYKHKKIKCLHEIQLGDDRWSCDLIVISKLKVVKLKIRLWILRRRQKYALSEK